MGLRAEHRDFRLKSFQIEEASEFSSHQAIEMLKEIRKPILRHALREEARIMRVIIQKAKEQSIKIMQEHKGIIEFLEKRISLNPHKKSPKRWQALQMNQHGYKSVIPLGPAGTYTTWKAATDEPVKVEGQLLCFGSNGTPNLIKQAQFHRNGN
jgi:vacuolar-type H+-ATPase subunit H